MIRIIEAREFHLPELVKIENACILPPWSEADLRNEIGRSDGLCPRSENGGDTAEGGVLGFCILRRAADEAESTRLPSAKTRGAGA